MAGICTLSGVADADSARASMRYPTFHEGPAAHRCMGVPPTHGGARRLSGQEEKLHKEVKQ